HAKLRATVSPQQSHGQESVNDGSADISLATISDVQQAVTGTADWVKKGPQKNILLISRIVPIRTAALVRLDSPIKTIADLKGKRAPSGFPAQPSVLRVVQAQLASAGMSMADIVPVPTRNIIGSADDFASGKTDVFWFALGSAKVKQVASGVGGLRALSIASSDDAKKAMRKYVPGSYPVLLKPSRQLEEIRAPTWALAYDVVLFARKDLSEEIVYKTTKAMFENKKDMAAVFGALNGFQPDRMAVAYDDLGYHPGAIKFFKEKGQWPPKSLD
ncbi:MAG: TAXI family TRAP transporter solute-binding subunit, partial [Beijerinckiaceae bacterium]